MDGSGDVFIADMGNNRVVEVKANGTQTTVGSGLYFPEGVAVDGSGDVFIADTGNNRVVEVKADGTQTTVGSGLINPAGVAVDGSGDVFIADPSNNRGGGGEGRRHPDHRRLRAQVHPLAWRWTARATSSSPTTATTRWWR